MKPYRIQKLCIWYRAIVLIQGHPSHQCVHCAVVVIWQLWTLGTTQKGFKVCYLLHISMLVACKVTGMTKIYYWCNMACLVGVGQICRVKLLSSNSSKVERTGFPQIQLHQKSLTWRNTSVPHGDQSESPIGRISVLPTLCWQCWQCEERSAGSLVDYPKPSVWVYESVILVGSDWLDQINELLEFWKSALVIRKFDHKCFKHKLCGCKQDLSLWLTVWLLQLRGYWLFLCDTTCVNRVQAW